MKRSIPWRQRLLYAIVGTVGPIILRLYFITIRCVLSPRAQRNHSPKGIYPFWHSQQLLALFGFQHTHAAIMISRSKDGEYIARIAKAIGFHPVRGSSSRGGASALKELIRLTEAGIPAAITPDGPRGPRYAVNPGILLLARKSGYPIVPMAIGCSAFWELRSWDKFRIPKPFSVVYGCWGKPIHVPPHADAETSEHLTAELREQMIALEQHADATARMLKESKTQVNLPETE